MRARRGEDGFTLIEILVVLAIIGIAAGATVLGLGVATRKVSTEAEAQRLAARFRLAADDSMITGQPMTFTWEGSRYAFTGATTDKSSFAPHSLPAGMTLDMGRPAGSLPLGTDGDGAPIRTRLVSASESWTVDYDGLAVTASPAPAG